MIEPWPSDRDLEPWEEGLGPPPLFAIPPPPVPPGLFCDETSDAWISWKNKDDMCAVIMTMDGQVGELSGPAWAVSMGTLCGAIFITIAAIIAWRRGLMRSTLSMDV
ncbi:hypothetical protein QYM36_016076, partial [Artemia franciscana]